MVEKHSELSGNTYAISIPTLNPEEPNKLKLNNNHAYVGFFTILMECLISHLEDRQKMSISIKKPIPPSVAAS